MKYTAFSTPKMNLLGIVRKWVTLLKQPSLTEEMFTCSTFYTFNIIILAPRYIAQTFIQMLSMPHSAPMYFTSTTTLYKINM